jgi:hypothetical protein
MSVKMVRYLVLGLILALMLGCVQPDEDMLMMKNVEMDDMMKKVDSGMMQDMENMIFEFQGGLEDVTGGEASGKVGAIYSDEKFMLLATFDDLQEPPGTDFYEGWIVRGGIGFSVISTGRVEMVEGKYQNAYASGRDLTDHQKYVLTQEPDDGDPAPAAHVLEGKLRMLK